MWNRTTNVDVSNGEIRLSLAGLEDDQNGRKDATRQPGLYENFESGSKFFFGCSKFCVQSFASVFTSLLQLDMCFCTCFV